MISNLRLYGGKVPIDTGDPVHPIKLVDFPTRAEFEALYANRVKAENVGRYYEMMTARASGERLEAVAKRNGVTRERARQIEAKFLRLMRQQSKPS